MPQNVVGQKLKDRVFECHAYGYPVGESEEDYNWWRNPDNLTDIKCNDVTLYYNQARPNASDRMIWCNYKKDTEDKEFFYDAMRKTRDFYIYIKENEEELEEEFDTELDLLMRPTISGTITKARNRGEAVQKVKMGKLSVINDAFNPYYIIDDVVEKKIMDKYLENENRKSRLIDHYSYLIDNQSIINDLLEKDLVDFDKEDFWL